MSEILRINCPAKINLTLEVLGRRPDGYHELRTVFQAISLADELLLSLAPGEPPLIVSGIDVPVTDNLCLRAVDAYRRFRPGIPSVGLKLHKHIPVGAGLGGGSSDAAGVLLGLEHLFGPLPPEGLRTLATELGSDVVFFLRGGTARGEGRGECLTPLPDLPATWVVVARPPLAVSTAEAYAALEPEDFTGGEHTAAFIAGLQSGCDLRQLTAHMYNGFARTVLARYPAIAAVQVQLLWAGAEAALLSGSGAAVFGLFADELSAVTAAATLTDAGTWAKVAVTIAEGARVRA